MIELAEFVDGQHLGKKSALSVNRYQALDRQSNERLARWRNADGEAFSQIVDLQMLVGAKLIGDDKRL
jgi:hypothetical protein